MARKRQYTHDEAVERIPEGWKLLEEYKRSDMKYWFKCPSGNHLVYKTYRLVFRDYGCKECRAEKWIRDALARIPEGWALLEPYEGMLIKKYWFTCPDGHRIQKWMNDLVNGSGCSMCYGNKPYTHDEAVERLPEGWKILEEYHGANHKHWFECPSGHLLHKRYDELTTREQDCSQCRTAKAWEEALARIPEGWTLLDPYRGYNEKYLWLCPEGHRLDRGFADVVDKGSGCRECSGWNYPLNHDEAVERLPEGWKLLEEYKGTSRNHLFECPEGHQTDRQFSNVLQSGCRECATHGFDYTAPAIVYLIEISPFDFKFGITNLDPDIDPRDGKRVPYFETLLGGKLRQFWRFDIGEHAHKVEQQIKRNYAAYIPDDPRDPKDGRTERIKCVFIGEVENAITRVKHQQAVERLEPGTQLSLLAGLV